MRLTALGLWTFAGGERWWFCPVLTPASPLLGHEFFWVYQVVWNSCDSSGLNYPHRHLVPVSTSHPALPLSRGLLLPPCWRPFRSACAPSPLPGERGQGACEGTGPMPGWDSSPHCPLMTVSIHPAYLAMYSDSKATVESIFSTAAQAPYCAHHVMPASGDYLVELEPASFICSVCTRCREVATVSKNSPGFLMCCSCCSQWKPLPLSWGTDSVPQPGHC